MKLKRLLHLTRLVSGVSYYLLQVWEWRRRQRVGCRRWAAGCFLLLLALSALACGTFFGVLQIAQAAPATSPDSLLPKAHSPRS